MLRESIDSFLLYAFAGQKIRLALLANLLRGDGRHPILIVGPCQPSHFVAAVHQDRDDFTLDILLALTQHDDVTGSQLWARWRRRLGLRHDQRSPRVLSGPDLAPCR